MAVAEGKAPVTVVWPEGLVNFVKKGLFEKTSIKFSQLSQLAMEAWLKENGHWNDYQASLAQDIM